MSIWRITMALRTLRHPDLEPMAPGAMLDEFVIPATGKSKAENARLDLTSVV